MTVYNTPLKWAGSKVRIMEELRPLLPKGRRLVEPFMGSGAVFMNTDYDQYLLADVNGDLINFYNVVMHNPESFIRRAKGYFEDMQGELAYYTARNHFNFESDLEYRAIMFLFLNRHCYNGLSRYNRSGKFNVPWGRREGVYFPESEIRQFSEKANAKKAVFICCAFEETLAMTVAGDAIYCDPPYAASFTQYHTGGFDQDDQQRLANDLRFVARHGCNVAVSNDHNPRTIALYSGFTHHIISAPRSMSCKANGRQPVRELVATLGATS
ncbi:Dam family site-specific DNA-(adenine-N6)-methyltransferase [Serratia fonticola]|uniref:DNA adenine methylase n=1 Tax=Serratia fonticola TaxID=47917 RepID=UPI0015771419|nr:Dam family site-specific DNA-(adenine-N6)-methyltransferase [Serratia fonticola]NTY87802.1 Dam family site-specific DNA-(adenine-N6)-methyltransferase [Serratia fonticola]NTZ13473.1 Dam family site-specific DNA-(adenine-N6)-methyltransferase [Serratia fonticola]